MKATYTQWDTYHTCPYQYHRLYTAKGDERVKRASSEALEKGIRVHDGIEKYILGQVEAIPQEVHPSWQNYLDQIKADAPATEARLDNDIAYGKLDVFKEGVYCLDWKTGKARISDPGKRDQLRFYIWLAGESLSASLLWVEHPINKAELRLFFEYTPILDRVWRGRIEKMQSDTKHVKTPNWKCNFCPVEDCEFFKNWRKK